MHISMQKKVVSMEMASNEQFNSASNDIKNMFSSGRCSLIVELSGAVSSILIEGYGKQIRINRVGDEYHLKVFEITRMITKHDAVLLLEEVLSEEILRLLFE